MDLFEELEKLAFNTEVSDNITDKEPSQFTIQTWRRLFGYTYSEASEAIKTQRTDFTRTRVSNEHWEMVKDHKESEGHDKESYEHELASAKQRQAKKGAIVKYQATQMTKLEARARYVIKLEGILATPEAVQIAADLAEPPPVLEGHGDDGVANFVEIDAFAKFQILAWLSSAESTFSPIFTRITEAEKDLSRDSAYPTLGIETTLPQHRANDTTTEYRPRQEQYPVNYFFYGTLASKEILSRLFGVQKNEVNELVPASIMGGKLGKWGGKYKALVDGSDEIDGHAFRVDTREQENALRGYETHMYEVVRCRIILEGGKEVQGCTFRFIGDAELK